MISFLSDTAAIEKTKSFWQFLLHPLVALGMATTLGGIVLGNMGIWKMMDVAEEETSATHNMFSTGAVTSPKSPNAGRAAAVNKYRKTQPEGHFYKMLRIGQALTIVGFLIMLIGAVQLAGAFS